MSIDEIDFKILTSEDVRRWFEMKRDATGVPKIRVGFDTSYSTGPFYAGSADYALGTTQFFATLEDAISAYVGRIPTPASIAAKKREEAQRLLEEAAALEQPVASWEKSPVGRNLDAKA